MDAKKALKKLKKRNKKLQSFALTQLKQLVPESNSVQSQPHVLPVWKDEIKTISQQTLVSVVSELATPLNPLLSWFNGGRDHSHHVSSALNTPSLLAKSSQIKQPQLAVKSVLFIPLKSPPCKQCPALSNGMCKCAAKKFKSSTLL